MIVNIIKKWTIIQLTIPTSTGENKSTKFSTSDIYYILLYTKFYIAIKYTYIINYTRYNKFVIVLYV